MKKEEIIIKWLNHEPLTQEETYFLESLVEYQDYKKIVDKATVFKAPVFDQVKSYNRIKEKAHQKSFDWSVLYKIAAVIVVVVGCYFAFFFAQPQQYNTLAQQTKEIRLPDNSVVLMNAESALSYEKKNWDDKRKLQLQGEAFFDVEKGKKFTVLTKMGEIEVLGTEFNVHQRNGFLSVECYEGLVEVRFNNKKIQLEPQEGLTFANGKLIEYNTKEATSAWINGYSIFKSIPVKEVIEELERQYNIEITLKNIKFDNQQLFTGNITHKNLETALKSVTIPFGYTYQVSNNSVVISAKKL
ncbi:FecR family protein [Mesonia sp. K7]|uniref:FecR family protein n=1 Tax=Mesonia sp. K7 TaxID=2218606 RepID=UPI001314237C|nr:FecR family protein [Mesonia sp. K7]